MIFVPAVCETPLVARYSPIPKIFLLTKTAFSVHFEDWAHFSEGRQGIARAFASVAIGTPSPMAGTRSGDSD